MKRKSGILCHISSLPNEYNIGDLGSNAYYFLDFLKYSGQTLWQILPLCEPGSSNSPYQPLSAYGGNPMLISPEMLYRESLVSSDTIENIKVSDPNKTDYNTLATEKNKILYEAAEKFIQLGLDKSDEFGIFIKQNDWWLNDNALFMVLRSEYKGLPWNLWDTDIADRKPEKIKELTEILKTPIKKYKIIQFIFYSQWYALKEKANEKGIKIIGDMPMYVDHDSATVWANKEYFMLDSKNNPAFVAGVPPDYFCEDGQYWGNPLYNWENIKKDNFDFILKRIKLLLNQTDILRIDHFRGFSQSWKIKANPEKTAKCGEWMDVPGYELFAKLKEDIQNLPIIAEDLGEIDEKVIKLRDTFNLPGMSVLQFAFDGINSTHLPHNQTENKIIYTGTHDNNTTIGWWKNIDEGKKDYVRKYFACDGNDINWQMIQGAMRTNAKNIIIPIQDIMNLDENYRMNTPGIVSSANWTFRFTWDQLKDEYAERLKDMTYLYNRN